MNGHIDVFNNLPTWRIFRRLVKPISTGCMSSPATSICPIRTKARNSPRPTANHSSVLRKAKSPPRRSNAHASNSAPRCTSVRISMAPRISMPPRPRLRDWKRLASQARRTARPCSSEEIVMTSSVRELSLSEIKGIEGGIAPLIAVALEFGKGFSARGALTVADALGIVDIF